MDMVPIIRELRRERSRINRWIRMVQQYEAEQRAKAEEYHAGYQPIPQRKRGRKFMSAEERQIVSQRMRNYWDRQRAIKRQAWESWLSLPNGS